MLCAYNVEPNSVRDFNVLDDVSQNERRAAGAVLFPSFSVAWF